MQNINNHKLMFFYVIMIKSAWGLEIIYPLSSLEYIIYSLISLGLVFFGGLLSGLTVGLLSIDELELEIKILNGTASEKKQAKSILKVLANHHLLLVTLLVANAACMETLPIMLNKMLIEVFTVVISVTFVLVFGEVLPQAFCTGPKQLRIASYLCPFVRILMILLWPISYPISKVLDCIFGRHRKLKKLKNEELKTLISLHHSFSRRKNIQSFSGLVTRQINIIHGTIDLQKKTVKDCMIPYDRVFMMSNETVLDKPALELASKQGYSRIPVFDPRNKNEIVGILLMKKLVLVQSKCSIKDCGISLREPLYISSYTPMVNLLAKFKSGKSHIAIVKNPGEDKILGIITFEDLLEEIIKNEIFDEEDYEKNVICNKPVPKIRAANKKPYSALHPLLDSQERRLYS
jgi:metal transporter CNNM